MIKCRYLHKSIIQLLIKTGNKKKEELTMEIKYPKTEILAVLGSKVYPLYTTMAMDDVDDKVRDLHSVDFLTFEVAIKKSHANGLWYPGCGDKPAWTSWTVKRDAIASYVKLPEPKVDVQYRYGDSDDDDDASIDFD